MLIHFQEININDSENTMEFVLMLFFFAFILACLVNGASHDTQPVLSNINPSIFMDLTNPEEEKKKKRLTWSHWKDSGTSTAKNRVRNCGQFREIDGSRATFKWKLAAGNATSQGELTK